MGRFKVLIGCFMDFMGVLIGCLPGYTQPYTAYTAYTYLNLRFPLLEVALDLVGVEVRARVTDVDVRVLF